MSIFLYSFPGISLPDPRKIFPLSPDCSADLSRCFHYMKMDNFYIPFPNCFPLAFLCFDTKTRQPGNFYPACPASFMFSYLSSLLFICLLFKGLFQLIHESFFLLFGLLFCFFNSSFFLMQGITSQLIESSKRFFCLCT